MQRLLRDSHRLLCCIQSLLFQIEHINIVLQIEISKLVSGLLALLFVTADAQIGPHHSVAPIVMQREPVRIDESAENPANHCNHKHERQHDTGRLFINDQLRPLNIRLKPSGAKQICHPLAKVRSQNPISKKREHDHNESSKH